MTTPIHPSVDALLLVCEFKQMWRSGVIVRIRGVHTYDVRVYIF